MEHFHPFLAYSFLRLGYTELEDEVIFRVQLTVLRVLRGGGEGGGVNER